MTTELRVCARCGKTVANWYTSGNDDRCLCETCAVAEYKAAHPATWDLPLRRESVIYEVKS